MEHTHFSIREALGFGWDAVTKDIGLYACATLLYFVILVILRMTISHDPEMFVWNFIVHALLVILEVVFFYNLYAIGFKNYNNQKVVFKDFYAAGTLNQYLRFLAVLVLKILFAIPIVGIGAALILLFAKVNIFLVPLFIAILALALLYYMVVMFFADAFVVSGMDPMKALGESIRLSKGNHGKIFLFYIAIILIVIVAAIPFGLGLLVVVPLIPTAIVVAYEKIKGNDALHHSPSEQKS